MIHSLKKSVGFLVLSVILTSCSREAEQTSKVLIQLPAQEKLSTSSLSTFSDDNPDDDDLGWSSDIPDGLITSANATKPINCYAVMVEGPEPLMRINTCGRRDNVTRKIDPTLFGFKVGLWMGAIPGGSTSAPQSIAMEIPTGPARIFRLIGFHVDDIVDCVLLQGDPDRTEMSRPYVIAESAPIDLAPGEKDVPMNMVFDSEKWFDDCDFGGGGDGNYTPPVATQIQIRKESFPGWQFVHSTSAARCQALEFQLTDSIGRPGVMPPGLQRIAYSLSGFPRTYVSKADCIADTSNTAGNFTFDVVAGASTGAVRRWVRIPATPSSISYNLALTEVAVDPAGAVSGIVPAPTVLMSTALETESFLNLVAPPLALMGEVYEVEVLRRSYDGVHFAVVPGASIGNSNPAFRFFADDTLQCQSASLGSVLASLTSTVGTYCLEYPEISGASSNITFSGQYAGRVEARAGGDDPQRLRILASNQISRLDAQERCFGPLSVILENEYGAAVLNETGAGINVFYNFAPDSEVNDTTAAVPMELHTSATMSGMSPSIVKVCPSSGAAWQSGVVNAEQLELNNYKLPFYIKVPANATLGWRKINFSATVDGRVIRGSYRFSIDPED